ATDRIQVEPRVTLPADWQFASALKIASRQGNELRFQSVSFTTLVDSPLIAGRHFKRIDLDPGARVPVFLNVVADRADNLAIDQRQIAQHRALIQQALALFGRAPFAHYDFLLSLSDRTGHFGLEHLQSSDDRLMADFFTDSDSYLRLASLLPHELVHAWNGKYRRPVGLATPDFATPMQTDLLWVYEGLTEYWAGVLSVRAGLWSADDYRQALAEVAQQVHYRRGRQWRSLQDTADAAPLQSYVGGWHNWRRTADYYPEGELLWLEIDARIRALSHNRRSLDDFARRFFAPDHTGATLRRYDFNDVVAALHAVQPADWAAFLRQRLDYTGNEAPVHGLERSGWQLQYAAAPTAYSDASSALMGGAQNLTASLGLFVSGDGRVLDVIWGGPAFKAGLVPGMQLVAVNGSDYSASALQDAIRAAHGKAPPLSLLVKYDTLYSRLSIDYHDGLRYPRLERRRGQPDYLSAILAPRHGAPSTSAKEHTP
ncbi:MAG TPA: M61 family peptidase, partial [Rhodanobacteraceae bacterium]|nr:M61 family peptidase [Rhodanobacteraceae bacterium]